MNRLKTAGFQGDNIPEFVTGCMYPPLSAVLYVIKGGEFIKTGKPRYILSHQKDLAKPNKKT
jgi:hypothetical protein